jgi:ATP-dependent RNA helicase RhlE
VLAKEGIKSAAIHGNKSQNARQNALSDFKDKKLRVLVATDIAARGIDIDDLAYVINFEIPNISETYVHRIGRTGRAGANGTALSFCDAEEKEFLKDIQKLINISIPVITDHPYPFTGFIPAKKESDFRNQRPKQNSHKKKEDKSSETKPKKKFFKQRSGDRN